MDRFAGWWRTPRLCVSVWLQRSLLPLENNKKGGIHRKSHLGWKKRGMQSNLQCLLQLLKAAGNVTALWRTKGAVCRAAEVILNSGCNIATLVEVILGAKATFLYACCLSCCKVEASLCLTKTLFSELSPGSTLLGHGRVTGPIRRRFVGANTTFLSR